MTFADLPGQLFASLVDPLLWAAMVLVALRVPLRFMLPAAIGVVFTMEAVFWLIESGEVPSLRPDPVTMIARALAAWLAGSVARFFIERRRLNPISQRVRQPN